MSTDSVITLSGWLFPLKMIQRRQKHLPLEPRPAFDTWSTTITVLWLHQFWKSAAIVKEGWGGLRVHNCEGGLWGGQKCRLDVLPWVQREPGIQHSAPPASSFQRINHNCAHILPSPLHLSFLLFAPQAAQMCKIMHLMSLLGYFCKFPAMNYSSLNSWFRQFRHTRTLTWILKLNLTLGVFSVCFSRLFFCQRDSSVKWILWRCRVFVRPGHPSGKFISLVS